MKVKDIDEAFNEMDADSSGSIEFEEFASLLVQLKNEVKEALVLDYQQFVTVHRVPRSSRVAILLGFLHCFYIMLVVLVTS